jgi:alanine-synthesizing transaminase
LPGQGASGKIGRFPRHCFALVVAPISSAPWELTVTADNKPRLRTIHKSSKLDNVCYDIRGPVMARARQMEEEGHRIIKLNIGNPAPFSFEAPEEIVQDVILNLPAASGYSDSKGLFAARKAIMHETQRKGIPGVQIDDIFVGNGVSELIVMAMQALLNNGDEVLVPAPDYPLWTAAVSLGGGKPRHYLCDEGAGWLPDLSMTSAPRSPRIRARSSSSTRTTRPARCTRPSCCWKSWKSRVSTS